MILSTLSWIVLATLLGGLLSAALASEVADVERFLAS